VTLAMRGGLVMLASSCLSGDLLGAHVTHPAMIVFWTGELLDLIEGLDFPQKGPCVHNGFPLTGGPVSRDRTSWMRSL
jgi:hypothetical protein